MPHRPQGIRPTIVDRHACARAGLVTDRIGAVVFMLPNFSAGFRVEAEDAFGLLRLGLAIGHEYAPVGDRRTAVPGADLHLPRRFQSLLVEPLHDSRFAP